MRKFSMVILSIMMFLLVACTNKAQVLDVETTEALVQNTTMPTIISTTIDTDESVSEINNVAKETIKKDDSVILNETQKKFLNGISSTEEFLKLCPTEADALKLETNGYCLVQVDGVDKLMTEDEAKAYYLDVLKSGNEVKKFTVYEGKAYQIYQSLYNETIGKAEIESKAQAKAQKEAEEKAHSLSLVKMLDNEIHLQNAIGSNGSNGNSVYWDGGADWGQTPFEGSALRAVNSLNPYGASGYCMRNGLVVPTGDSRRYWSSLGKSGCPARNEYSHVELEVFKINNPNWESIGFIQGGAVADPKVLKDSHHTRCMVNYIGEDMYYDIVFNVWQSGYTTLERSKKFAGIE